MRDQRSPVKAPGIPFLPGALRCPERTASRYALADVHSRADGPTGPVPSQDRQRSADFFPEKRAGREAMGAAVSEYSFGFDPSGEESDLGEANAGQQGPKWFREGLDKLSSQVQELRAENAALKAQKVKDEVADALKAKGYAPAAAGLYTGTPEKLDEWLTANGGALAKLPGEGQEQGEQAPSGPPASTVPAEGQEQMQRMMEQGTQGVAQPQGTDKEIAAAIAAAQSPEDFAKLMQSHGSPYDWNAS